jgi:hypothetical protein
VRTIPGAGADFASAVRQTFRMGSPDEEQAARIELPATDRMIDADET